LIVARTSAGIEGGKPVKQMAGIFKVHPATLYRAPQNVQG
jgi:hypothetical protein